MAKQTFTTGQVLTAAQMTSLQQTAMGGGSATAKTASYVLVAADAGGTVAMNAAGSTTITVNTGLFAAGDTVLIQNLGAGTCTITAGTATVNTAGSLALVQYESGILYFTATGAAIFNDYVQAGGGSSPLTTKGDLYGFSTLDARIPVGTNNQVLTADSAQALGLKWATPAVAASGLTFIKAETVGTAASSIEITSAFSTTYDNYLITFNGGAGSADSIDLLLQFGSTTTGYAFSGYYQSTTSATITGYASNSISNIGFGTMSTLGVAAEAFVANPFLSRRTSAACRSTPLISGDLRVDYAGRLENTTSYTSFKIVASGGTMTGGVVRVYGYQNN